MVIEIPRRAVRLILALMLLHQRGEKWVSMRDLGDAYAAQRSRIAEGDISNRVSKLNGTVRGSLPRMDLPLVRTHEGSYRMSCQIALLGILGEVSLENLSAIKRALRL